MADDWQRTQASELVFVCIGCLLMLLTIIAMLRSVRPSQLLALLRSMQERLRRGLRQVSVVADDEVGRIVQDKMREMTLRNMRRGARLSALCMSIITGLMTVSMLNGTGGRGFIPADIFALAVHTVAAFLALCPEAITWKTVDIWYSIGILVMVVYTFPRSDLFNDAELPRIMVSNIAVLYMNLERRDWRIVVPLNLVYGLSSSFGLMMRWHTMDFRMGQLVAVQLAMVAFFPACTYQVEVGIATTLRQSLEAEATSELLQAASALLQSYNDVVVELDSDGVIVGDVQGLASFLLRSPASLSARARLSDLVAEEDRQLFLSQLEAKRTDGCNLAEAVHVHMRDGNNALLKVEVSSFGYRRVDGQLRYMTGLRDFSDLPPSRCQASGPLAAELRASRLAVSSTRPSPAPGWQSEGSQSSSEGESPAAARIGTPLNDMNDTIGRHALLIVDGTAEGFPIIGASRQFQLSIGRARPGAHLLDLVHPAKEFADWLQMAAEVGAEWPASRVTLRMRQGDFRASCEVFHEEWEGKHPDKRHLHLRFDNIKRPKLLSVADDGCGKPARPHANLKGTPANPGNIDRYATL